MHQATCGWGCPRRPPPSSPPPTEDPNQAEGKDSPAFPAALAHHRSPSLRGEMPDAGSRGGSLGLPVPLPSQAMAVSPGTLLHGRRAPACAANTSIPKNHPGKEEQPLTLGSQSILPPQLRGSQRAWCQGKGSRGGGTLPLHPQPFGGRLSSAGFQSARRAPGGGKAAGAPWDRGESKTWRPPDSQGCRELSLMFVKPPERHG